MTTTEGFKRHGNHSYIAEFSESEKEVLLNLCEQIIELLAERVDHGHEDPLAAMVGITSHDSPPEDDVLRRLLPNAYADAVDASEFRRYTESTLRRSTHLPPCHHCESSPLLRAAAAAAVPATDFKERATLRTVASVCFCPVKEARQE